MWLLIILLCLCPCFPAWAQAPPYSFTGTVSYVYDGDTILAKDSENKYHRIRLASIDAPELSQPYGNEAARLLRTLVQDETILVSVIDIDKYNREVGNVYYGCANGVGGEWRKTPKRSALHRFAAHILAALRLLQCGDSPTTPVASPSARLCSVKAQPGIFPTSIEIAPSIIFIKSLRKRPA